MHKSVPLHDHVISAVLRKLKSEVNLRGDLQQGSTLSVRSQSQMTDYGRHLWHTLILLEIGPLEDPFLM